jgi:hypothetical protein
LEDLQRKPAMLSPTEVRLLIAHRLIDHKRQELGPNLVAAACYGSVAYGVAEPYSDVEVALVTRHPHSVRAEEFVDQHILVVCDYLPAASLLDAASRVTLFWGLEADGNRRFLPLWDPDGYFPRLQVAAACPPPEAFYYALGSSWYLAFELFGKVRNALLAMDYPRAMHHGWEFAQTSALRIALHGRKPYTISHALWHEAATRGYGMDNLVAALTTAAHDQLERTLAAVWAETNTWGAPDNEQ